MYSDECFINIGDYLINKLINHGVRHVFGVPGDFILGFYKQMADNKKIKVINTCDEQGAGFAADAYARINGLGACCITYCVGGLKVINPTAEAFAEKSPLVIISGSPGIKERIKNPLIHHKVKDFDTQLKIFEQVTVASTVIDDSAKAVDEIDRTINSALYYKRPVYIEIPRDMVAIPIIFDSHSKNKNNHHSFHQFLPTQGKSNPIVLAEAIDETIEMINYSKKPVILAGVEIHRYGLQNKLLTLVEKFKIPVASTISSKSVIGEYHQLYLGLYEGAMGHDLVKKYVETSDCLILLGTLMTDMDLGGFTAKLDQGKSISLSDHRVSIKYHNYDNIFLDDFISELISSKKIKQQTNIFKNNNKAFNSEIENKFVPIQGKRITINRLFQCINSFIKDNTIVLADIGESLFGSTDLVVHRKTEFLSPAYYASMGFAVPASIGAQLANSKLRPLVLVGDGAFQMTGMELSTSIRFNLNPIVLVLNNHGYSTERSILDGPFNDILNWQYSKMPILLGGGEGFVIETEEQLQSLLNYAEEHVERYCILDIHLDPNDKSQAMQRLTEILRKKLHE